MPYKAVGRRCAVNLDEFDLPVTKGRVLEALTELGFVVQTPSIVELARSCIDKSAFKVGARLSEAPRYVDCSSFMGWLYGKLGLRLPRRSRDQQGAGFPIFPGHELAGDLVFIESGMVPDARPADLAIHVGLVTGDGTVVHASGRRKIVEELPLPEFRRAQREGEPVWEQRFRRYATLSDLITLMIPKTLKVDSSDDVRRIILQSLG